MMRIWRHDNGSVHLQFYMICSSLLSLDDGNINDLQSTRYGWEYVDDSMKSMRMLNLIPDAICVTSKCKMGCLRNTWSLQEITDQVHKLL